MTPKEALAKDGFPVKAGRGRLSREAVERCRELSRQGWSIDGYVVSSTAPVNLNTPVEVKKVAVNGDKVIADLPGMRYDPRSFKAVSKVAVFGRTEFGMAEVCRCGNSLAYHVCDAPVVLGVPVTIVPRG